MTHPDEKLKELGIDLAEAKPFHPAVAVGVITDGNMLYVSGSTSPSYKGQLGSAVSVDDGYKAAREAAIAQIAAAKSVLGDLGRVKRVVKVLGMVNAAPGFTDTPAVIHGASELYYAVFGEKGVHARSAVGLSALPSDVSVEVETIFEVE